MTAMIELRGFMGLTELFSKRGWHNPILLDLNRAVSGSALPNALDISAEQVEVISVNGKAFVPGEAAIKPDDRVALGAARVLPGLIGFCLAS